MTTESHRNVQITPPKRQAVQLLANEEPRVHGSHMFN